MNTVDKIYILYIHWIKSWICILLLAHAPLIFQAQIVVGFDIDGMYFDGDTPQYRIFKENSEFYIRYANGGSQQAFKLTAETYDKSGKYQYGFSQTDKNTIATFTDLAFDQTGSTITMHVRVVSRGMGYEKTYLKKDHDGKFDSSPYSNIPITRDLVMRAAEPKTTNYLPLQDRLLTSSTVSQGRFYEPFAFFGTKPKFAISENKKKLVFSLLGAYNANSHYREFIISVTGAEVDYVETQIGTEGEINIHRNMEWISIPSNSPVLDLNVLIDLEMGAMEVLSHAVNLGYDYWYGEIFFTIYLHNFTENELSISLMANEKRGMMLKLAEEAFKPGVQLLGLFGEHNNPRKAFATYKLTLKTASLSLINIPLLVSSLTDEKRSGLYDAFMEYWFNNRPESLKFFDLNSPSASVFGFGDINGNGIDDGVVYWTAQAIGGNMHQGGFAIFLNDGQDNFNFLDLIGPKNYVSNMVIKNHAICGHEDNYKPSDPRCCPSIKTAFEIRLEDGKLLEKKVPR